MSEVPRTKESQYQVLFDVVEQHGVSKLGLMINQSWNQDPKRTLFTLARYKFVEPPRVSRRLVCLSPGLVGWDVLTLSGLVSCSRPSRR